MMKTKRTSRTREAAPEILERVSRGESLRKACEANNLVASTFMQLVREDEQIAEQYTRAREACLEFHADQLIDIADNPTGDYNRDRLRLDTRKWLLSKLLPKKYGDKLGLEHAGPDGGKLEFLVKVERDPGT